MDSRESLNKEIAAWAKDVEVLEHPSSVADREDYHKKFKEADAHLDTFQNSLDIFEEILRKELGEDPPAGEAFDHLCGYRFFEFRDCFEQKRADMTEDNEKKFKTILIRIAPMIQKFKIETPVGKEKEYEEYEKYLAYIIDVAGGDPKKVQPEDLEFPQFCFETMMCLYFKLEFGIVTSLPDRCIAPDKNDVALAQACRCVCEGIHESPSWELRKEETDILRYMSPRDEDVGGYCDFCDVWGPGWTLTWGRESEEK
jgi:hypothetical protein